MSEEFVPDSKETPTVPTSSKPTSHREPVKMLIIGSPRAINSIIRTQYRLGFAEVTSWSPLQPTGNPGEFINMLIRQISFS